MEIDEEEEEEVKVPETVDVPSKAPHKSWKRKYRKMRLKFDDAMKESSALFKNNHHALEIARRLREQNDQIIDFLDELNESTSTNPAVRYDLDETPSSEKDNPIETEEFSIASYPPAAAQAALKEAKADLDSGYLSPNSYKRLENTISRTFGNVRNKRLTVLQRIPHTLLENAIDNLPCDVGSEYPIGYVTPEQEKEYLDAVDEAIENGVGYSKFPARMMSNLADKYENEKELASRNPVSVYNWLRKHQPQVFLQDHDAISEKSVTRPSNARSSKRSNATPKVEQDLYDDDGILMDIPPAPPTRGKRKRDDETYRPKGGSSRPNKRKKDDASGTTKRSRRGQPSG